LALGLMRVHIHLSKRGYRFSKKATQTSGFFTGGNKKI
jgi:hypothetical protein